MLQVSVDFSVDMLLCVDVDVDVNVERRAETERTEWMRRQPGT